jgi:bifunctional NMN adenylyltransferase/nudix hydrolase
MKYDYLVFIGRLQPATLAHKHIIDQALTLSHKLIIVLGSSNSARTLRNPFTYAEREVMTRGMFDAAVQNRLLFVAQEDHTYQDEKWVMTLQSSVKQRILQDLPGNHELLTLHGWNDVKVGLIGHSKDSTSYYLGLFPGWANENVHALPGVDATAVRDALFDQRPEQIPVHHVHETVLAALHRFTQTHAYETLVQERAFVRKYQQQWANTPYPVIFHTVDACVIQSGHILLVKRGAMPGAGMWALPGGYLNPHETLLQGMLRELREETRLKVPEPVLRGSIQARETFDDPHRSPRGRVITTAFLIHLKSVPELPKVKGSDDAAHAQWVPLSDLDPQSLFEDHFSIIQVMLGKLRNL